MQKNFWQKALDHTIVHLHGSFVTTSGPFGMDFAHEIRKATREIKIDAMYCIQNFPHFAIMQQAKYDRDVVFEKCTALWNQCMCSMLVVLTPNSARMFSLAKSIILKRENEFEKQCLIRQIEIDQANSEFSKYVLRAKSGRIWREKNGDFDYRNRIDHVLLGNLKTACKELRESAMATDEAQAILIQTMFIAYLEDRGIITQDYFKSVSDNSVKSFANLLESGNSNYLHNLFKELKNDFNGDLLVAPCSFESTDKPIDVSPQSMKVLADFRIGNMELASGQFRLFKYNFKFIPIELISSVYDQFLTEKIDDKKSTGAFYTPVPLVEITLSSIWEYLTEDCKKNGTFLDPACGSGIFLVRCFQRLCEHYRTNMNTQEVPWPELRKIVNRLHGLDLNRNAVRISVFSLYVAMLDETPTKNIRKLVAEDCILPELWNNTLVGKDFFEEPAENLKVDVVLGNPPWSARSSLKNSAMNWSSQNKYSAPNNQMAWSFVWKAIEHIKNNGLIALLLPANDFLYNTDRPVKSRNSLFLKVELKRIVDFSDFRKHIFKFSSQPVALLAFTPQNEPVDDYKFEFWMPKAERNPNLDRFSNISSIDKSDLWLSFVIQDKFAFKQYAWMREPERRLFAYLNQFNKLTAKIETNEFNTDSDSNDQKKWLMGRGFDGSQIRNKGKTVPESFKKLIEFRYLDTKHFKPFSTNPDSLQEFSWNELSDFGIKETYYGSRILVNRGIRPSKNRLCVDYAEESFANKGQIIGIKNRLGQTDQTKLLAGLLSSSLASWFFFHSSGSFGVSIPLISQIELFEFPFPSPKELHNENQSCKAAKEIVKLIDRQFRYKKLDNSKKNILENEFLAEIDKLTYQYFCLTEDDIILIEDSVKYTIPSIHPSIPSTHPSVGSTKPLWTDSKFKDRQQYAVQLKLSLDDWFEDGTGVSIATVWKNEDVALLKLSLCNTNDKIDYDEDDNLDCLQYLHKLLRKPDYAIDRQEILDLKIFDGNDLYMFKPLLRRYWLKSTAIGDADEIIVELEKSSQKDNMIGDDIEIKL